MNSEPLSLLITAGLPYLTKRRARTERTTAEVTDPPGTIARAIRLNSSITVSILMVLPDTVAFSVIVTSFIRGTDFTDSTNYGIADSLLRAFFENGFAILMLCMLSLFFMSIINKPVGGILFKITTYLLITANLFLMLWHNQISDAPATQTFLLASRFLLLIFIVWQMKVFLIAKFIESDLSSNTAILFIPLFYLMVEESQIIRESELIDKLKYLTLNSAAFGVLFAYVFYWLYTVNGAQSVMGRLYYFNFVLQNKF